MIRKIIPLFLLAFTQTVVSQTDNFQFTVKVEIPSSPVKDQQRTGTCWSFATTSFVETELIRMQQPIFDISEMYFVRYAYEAKAENYVRFQGTNNFGQGGQAHDVMNVIRKYGMVTEKEYPGLNYGSEVHAHAELEAGLKAFLDAVVKNPNKKLTTSWLPAYRGILDAYLGTVPDKANSPLSKVPFNPDDYIEITSFNHHPFYKRVSLEIPDNWSHDQYYNIPLDEMMEVIVYALNNGYSVCWDGDVSEKSFAYRKGVALLPVTKFEEMSGSDKERWAGITEKDFTSRMANFDAPVPEINVTQENRQANFDNLTTTDDHLMHITGWAINQNGKTYFLTKNSWGTEGVYNGYLYMSEPYVRMKTIAVMVHKNAIPAEIKKKLAL